MLGWSVVRLVVISRWMGTYFHIVAVDESRHSAHHRAATRGDSCGASQLCKADNCPTQGTQLLYKFDDGYVQCHEKYIYNMRGAKLNVC